MSLNGSGVMLINSTGQPVVANTLISAAVFNAFTADVATALSTAVYKDGQQTITANIPMGGFRLTGLGAGSTVGDSLRYEQLFTTGTVPLLGALALSGGLNEARGSVAMHATTMDLWAQPNIIDGTSTAVTITAIANAPQAGARRVLYPVVGSVITNGATFAVDGGANATAAAGDRWEFEAITTSTYKVHVVSVNPVRATDLQVQLATAFTTGGTSTAFTLTPTPAITANAANQRFRVKFNAAAGTTPTLAVSGQAALNLKYKDSAGTKQAITATQVPINWVSDVENDGTDWVVLSVAGIAGIPQNIRSAAYTTVLEDANTHILHPSADTTARIFTIDSNANVAYPIGTAITFVNQNAGGVVTIAITTDTMRLAGAGTTGSRTLAANGIATAIKLTSTEWIISGTGLT